jgi:hypothetical protein
MVYQLASRESAALSPVIYIIQRYERPAYNTFLNKTAAMLKSDYLVTSAGR